MIRIERSGLKPWPGLSPDILLCIRTRHLTQLYKYKVPANLMLRVINPVSHPGREGGGRKNTPGLYLQISAGLISHLAFV